MPTLLIVDGFEHGRTTGGGALGVADGVTGTPAIVTTPVRTGARALEIATSVAAEGYTYNIPAGNRVLTTSFYIRFPSFGDATVLVFPQADNGLQVISSRFRLTGGTAFGPDPLVVDTWYRVDYELNTTANPWVQKCKIDGGTESTSSPANAAADITSIRLGTTGIDTYTAYYDDYVISVTGGDYPIGAHSVEALIPSSDGTHNITTSGDFDSFSGTAFSNSTTNGNTFIGHRPLQAANTADQVIRQELGTTANYMEFGLENLSAGTDIPIDARTYGVHVDAANVGASLAEMRLLLSDNTEVLTTGSVSMINSTEDPGLTVTLRKRMAIRPAGGWDRTKVDGLKIRLGFSDNAPDTNFIDSMIEVALQPLAVVASFLWIPSKPNILR